MNKRRATAGQATSTAQRLRRRSLSTVCTAIRHAAGWAESQWARRTKAPTARRIPGPSFTSASARTQPRACLRARFSDRQSLMKQTRQQPKASRRLVLVGAAVVANEQPLELPPAWWLNLQRDPRASGHGSGNAAVVHGCRSSRPRHHPGVRQSHHWRPSVVTQRSPGPARASRYAGGSLIGRALLAKDSAADEAVGTVRLIALPRRLGLWLPR